MALKEKILAHKSDIRIAKIAVALCVVWLLVFGYAMPCEEHSYSAVAPATISSGWTQIVQGESIPLDDIAQFIPTSSNTPLVIQRTITEDMIDRYVLFYAEHQEVNVTVGGNQVYSLVCSGAAELFNTPGRIWVSIPISRDMLGETLQISLKSAFPIYHNLPAEIHCVSEGTIHIVQTQFVALRNTFAFLVLILAVITYTHAALWNQKKLRRNLFVTGDLYLFVGIWLWAEANWMADCPDKALFSAVVSMILLRVLPVVFYYFVTTLIPYTSWRMRLVKKLVWINLFGSLLLQMVFDISLLTLTPVNLVVIMAGCILGLVEIYEYHRSGMQFLTLWQPCYAIVLLFGASLVECWFYLNHHTCGHLIGIPLSVGCVLYFLVTYIAMTRDQSTTATEKHQLEKAYSTMNIRPLNQQINSHFLYNSLNTIGAYCKEDPDQAYEAIRLMGKYMRAYTQLIGADDYVALEEELDLMHTYMAIQNMRFENSIQFSINHNCDDVLLPPLALQPLVENAVNHAIRKGTGSGEIRITSSYKYNMAEITVSDDGVGFDTKELKTGTGLGLRNLERRIKAMGGHMTVRSAPGRGTKVILMVPMEHTTMEDDEFDRFICGR